MPTQPRQLHDAPGRRNAGQPAPACGGYAVAVAPARPHRADEQPALTLENSALVVALAIAIVLPLGYFALAFEITHSLRGVLSGTALMALLGLVLGGTAYTTMRTVPLRALRRATAALHQEQGYWKFALEGGGDGVWDRNVQTGEILHSKRCLEVFGYTGDEPASLLQDWESRIHPDDLPRVKASQQAHFDGKTTLYSNEHRMRCKDGSWKWVLTRGMLVSRDAAGKPLRIIGAHTDITERKQAEDARARLAAIVENSNDAIIGRTLDGEITSWNAAAVRMFGFSAGEVIGQPLAIIMPGPHRDFMKNNESLLLSEVIPAREKVRVTKDGRPINVTVSVSPVKNESGQVVGAAVIIHDISERIRAEQQILKLNAELEQRVVERTRQMEATNKELEAFCYSVSHDLRAPLRGIDGFSQILLQKYAGRLDETGSDYLQRIRRASLRMGELIDDLLQLSKVSRAKVTIEAVDLSQLARSILRELGDREPQRRVATEVQDGVEIGGDPRLLRIALENLLGNAWKFTGKREEARILFGAREQDGEQAVFVEDNGAGFDIKYAHKLFGAFQRLHGATEFDGTGIGLATVQRVINLHGGRIWADSTLGKGATFYFVIPRALRNETATA